MCPNVFWIDKKIDCYNNVLLHDFDKLNDIINQITTANITISEGVDILLKYCIMLRTKFLVLSNLCIIIQ